MWLRSRPRRLASRIPIMVVRIMMIDCGMGRSAALFLVRETKRSRCVQSGTRDAPDGKSKMIFAPSLHVRWCVRRLRRPVLHRSRCACALCDGMLKSSATTSDRLHDARRMSAFGKLWRACFETLQEIHSCCVHRVIRINRDVVQRMQLLDPLKRLFASRLRIDAVAGLPDGVAVFHTQLLCRKPLRPVEMGIDRNIRQSIGFVIAPNGNKRRRMLHECNLSYPDRYGGQADR